MADKQRIAKWLRKAAAELEDAADKVEHGDATWVLSVSLGSHGITQALNIAVADIPEERRRELEAEMEATRAAEEERGRQMAEA